MDMGMAVGAVLKNGRPQVVELGWNRSSGGAAAEAGCAVMAFQAHGEYYWPAKQPRIRRPVRKVADFAAFHPNWRMLVNEWPAFFFVTFKTSFFVA